MLLLFVIFFCWLRWLHVTRVFKNSIRRSLAKTQKIIEPIGCGIFQTSTTDWFAARLVQHLFLFLLGPERFGVERRRRGIFVEIIRKQFELRQERHIQMRSLLTELG
ncbi:MAG TPA: hypothetical protein VN873_13340 [Candidatus Angelobacter sp.]|nr:hypothetical protein [Candidatus Angelobacter sp.]